MNYRRLFLALYLCAWLPASAQTLRVSGFCPDSVFHDMKLFLRLLDSRQNKNFTVPLTVSGQTFNGQALASSTGFYYLCGATKKAQIMLPVYLPDTTKNYKFKLSLAIESPKLELDTDNDALSAYNTIYYNREKEFWTEAKNWTAEKFQPFICNYLTAADSVANRYKCSKPVADYLSLWAYSIAYGDYTSIPHVSGLKLSELPFKASDVFGDLRAKLDNSMTVFFPALVMAVVQSVPNGNLTARMEYLYSNYSSKEVLAATETALLDDYIRRFDFDSHYDEGLAEMQAVTDKYSLDNRYVDAFKKRKASVKGSKFPDVALTDVNGNAVSFSSFRGSYVYVDMWASWCGPCCKEAPYLEALEKELAGNENIKFVSVSIDKNPAAWKKKMTDLNLHGNQLLNQDNKLAEALNVQGIPFFLIYDRKGRLYMYNAPRPSHPQLKVLLEGLD